ncbi:hypothetical protein [Bacillus sp. OK048]|uniref:hypothetical protein n=1 Tax=Bacillus sp. OK048 TaxID=1882761 RepID=UPI0034A0E817
MHGQFGYDGDVALSMPCIVGRSGVEQQLEIALNTQELECLHQSAEYIKEAMKVAKTGKIHNSL